MGVHQVPTGLQIADFPAGAEVAMMNVPGIGAMFGYGTTVPTTVNVWAPGSVFVHYDGGVGTNIYKNDGSYAAPNFTFLGSGSTSTLDAAGTLTTAGSNLAWTWASQTSVGTLNIPDLNLAAGTTDFVFTGATQTLAAKTLTTPTIASFTNATHDHSNAAGGGSLGAVTIAGPDINGGTADSLTSLSVRDTGAAQDVTIQSTSTGIAGGLTLTLDLNNANATVDFNGNVSFGGTVAFTGAVSTAGTFTVSAGNLTLDAQAGGSRVTIPTGSATSTVLVYDDATDAQGDIMMRGAAGYQRLGTGSAGECLISGGAGANLAWGTPSIGQTSIVLDLATLNDTGGLDIFLDVTDQTIGKTNLVIPDLANVTGDVVVHNLAQTLSNKVLTAPDINGGTADALTSLSVRDTGAAQDVTIQSTSTGIAGGLTLTLDLNNANATVDFNGNVDFSAAFATSGGHSLTLTTGGATNVTLPTTGTLATIDGIETHTNKTFTTPTIGDFTNMAHDHSNAANGGNLGIVAATSYNLYTLTAPAAGATLTIADGKTFTCNNSITIDGTDGKTLTLNETMTLTAGAASQTFTFPAVGATVLTTDSTATLTNKTMDCDAAGNVLSNVNADELDPVANATYGISFIIRYTLSNQAAAVNIYNANAPFKFRVCRAWSIATSADGGTWKLNDGAAGAGADLTNAVAVAANDEDIDEPTDYNDAAIDIASGGSLSVVPDGGGALDVELFIECMRID